MKKIILAVLLLCPIAFASCRKESASVPKHELTKDEQTKARLDSLSLALLEELDLGSQDELKEYIKKNSSFSISLLNRSLTYALRASDKNIVIISLRLGKKVILVDGTLYGGMTVKGDIDPSALFGSLPKPSLEYDSIKDYFIDVYRCSADVLDAASNLYVCDTDGTRLADLGFESWHSSESGEDKWYPIPVFRFSDGTSYLFTTLLLNDALIERFLSNED
ncbi:MAG: hypothetical protein IJ795_07320 [Bacteroidales bacterium]|nr:hypothetical protein [Bacteroidales bacterium]